MLRVIGEAANFMSEIISMLLLYIEIQNKIIIYLIGAVLGKNSYRKNLDKPVNKPYRRLHVDDLPIIEIPEKLNYLSLLQEYHQKHGKNLKPVKPHKNSKARVPNTLSCPCCSAPSIYIYDNNGGRGQYRCKVCTTNFNFKNYYSKAANIIAISLLRRLRNVRISISINVRMMVVLSIKEILLL